MIGIILIMTMILIINMRSIVDSIDGRMTIMKRKKILLIFLSLALLTVLFGCKGGKTPSADNTENLGGLQPGDVLYQTFKDGLLADIDNDKPVKIEVNVDKNGEETLYIIENEEELNEAIELFKNITIAGPGYSVTDNYNSIAFVYEDGTSQYLSFELWYLATSENGHYYNYELSNLDEFLEYVYDHALH